MQDTCRRVDRWLLLVICGSLLLAAALIWRCEPFRVREHYSRRACFVNLLALDAMLRRYAAEVSASNGATLSMDDLRPYYPRWQFPYACPDGGTYSLRVGELPRCSIGGIGHQYPQTNGAGIAETRKSD